MLYLRRVITAIGLLAGLGFASFVAAQVPADHLFVPPANAQKYEILSVAGVHGHSLGWIGADGTHYYRESLMLRGQVWEMDERITSNANRLPVALEVRGISPQGDTAETFEAHEGHAQWKTQVDVGQSENGASAYYVSYGGTSLAQGDLLEALLAAPDHALNLLPSGRATATKLTQMTVGEGDAAKTIVAWNISGLGNGPYVLWATEDGHFFAAIGFLSVMPEGYAPYLSKILDVQEEALNKTSPALAHRFQQKSATPIAFVHVKTYDSVGAQFLDDQTVIVDKGLITAVGAASKVKVPATSKIIDGKGHTLVPGLWDAHQHVGDDFSGAMLLSLGITSVRDPGNNNDSTVSRLKRRAAGDLLMPHIYASVLLDGNGPNTAQIATVVTTKEEVLAAVRKAKADGFIGIKLYGSFPREYVAPAIKEAHRLGLHVHGHLPAGMRPTDAINAGYDEITHIYFVMMQAMPDSVVNKSNGIMRMQGMGLYARDVKLGSMPMQGVIDLMARRHITSDPTLVVVEGLLTAESGEMSPAYAPFVGTLPPATERSFKGGGLALMNGNSRAQYKDSFKNLEALVLDMRRAGVPIVAGTDGSGLELVRELELYVEAGMTPSEALQTATLAPARLVGQDKRTGSITVGKVADLVLVEGDPSVNISDLRHTRLVMIDGYLMDADALREASGFSGRPK